VPIAYLVFAVGLAEVVAWWLTFKATTDVIGEFAFGIMVSLVAALALSQVELAGCWLVVGRRWVIFRMASCASLPWAWSCIFESLPVYQVPWIAPFSAVTLMVIVVSLAGRLLGLELRELRDGTRASASEDTIAGRFQFSIADLLAFTLLLAVVFAPFRAGLQLGSVLGERTWLNVGRFAAVAALSWVIACAVLAIGRARRRRGRSSGAVKPDGRLTAICRTNSWDSQMEYFVLVTLAFAWLSGPLRGSLYGQDPLGEPMRWDRESWISLAVSASWTLTIAWTMLTVEEKWRRWGPSVVVYPAGIVCLGVSFRSSAFAALFLFVFLLQTAWSLLTLLLVRSAGYRLCRVRRKEAPQ
jgi:hypothetical protein